MRQESFDWSGGASAVAPGGPEPWLREVDPAQWPVADAWRSVLDHFWADRSGRDLLAYLRARVRDGDLIRLEIDTRSLSGSVDVIGLDAAEFARRDRHPSLKPDPRVPADTRLWAALQNASGGSWGGCVYDAERVTLLLELGLAAERGQSTT